jgi:OmpA-OmpF porin, OOP family
MKKPVYIIPLALGFSATVTVLPTAAHDLGEANNAYVGDTAGHLVTDGYGNCVQTGSWNHADDIVDCGAAATETAALEPQSIAKPEPVAKAVATALTLSGSTLFGFDSNKLSNEGQAELNKLVEQLKAMDAVKSIRIVGHTDNQGPSAYNELLSLQRATTVKSYLVAKGIKSDLITTLAAGENSPVALNSNPQGRAQNRRVEISINGTQTP